MLSWSLCRRFIKVSEAHDGTNFWVTMPDGQKSATPLLLALAVIEISDVVFAVDSIPAVCLPGLLLLIECIALLLLRPTKVLACLCWQDE